MIKCMQICKINPQIIKLIEKVMALWNSTLILLWGRVSVASTTAKGSSRVGSTEHTGI